MDTQRRHIHSLLILLILFVMGGHTPLQAITRIYGSVIDSTTQETMPYVSVYLRNTTDGCQTDKDGNFSFLSAEERGVLVVSSVGYEERYIPIDAHTRYPLHIKLAPAVYELSEVEIKPERERYRRKDNPAVELVQGIIKKREKHRLDSHEYYSRDRHELLTIALSNFDKSKLQKELLERVGVLQNYLDT